MAKLTISFELNPSDFPFLLALLANGGELRTPNPSSEGFRTRGPFTNLEDLLRDLASEGSDESERMRAYRDARGPKTTGATEAGDDTPPDETQGSEREPEGTAETPEDTRLRFYVRHERED